MNYCFRCVELANNAVEQRCRPNQVKQAAGEPVTALYQVVRGTLRIEAPAVAPDDQKK